MIATQGQDLTSLSLDAALQLDLLERAKAANLEVIKDFAESLISTSSSPCGISALGMSASPMSVEIFNSAVSTAEDTRIDDLDGLQQRVTKLVSSINEVANGSETNVNSFKYLKRFCLALHQTLLNEAAPFKRENDWLASRENLFA